MVRVTHDRQLLIDLDRGNIRNDISTLKLIVLFRWIDLTHHRIGMLKGQSK